MKKNLKNNLILLTIAIFLSNTVIGQELKKCERNNKKEVPCITISSTPNTSKISEIGIEKIIISKQDIENSGVTSISDILRNISGLNVYQSGHAGQSSSIFTRSSESNHTLVLLNGIAINDQSVTDGMHDFGQDFVQTIQQIEVYKGSNGSQFGPSAMAGAINFITAIDYTNSFSVNGFNDRNNSINGNITKILENGWYINVNATGNQSNLGSSTADGVEDDGTMNRQLNLNAEKWINDNTKVNSTFYVRETRTYYDDMDNNGELGYVMDNTMQALQTAINRVGKNGEDSLTFHWHAYGKDIDDGGYSDSYDSQALVTRYEKKINSSEKLSVGIGSEYKYDWGSFVNEGSFNSSTKGHVKDLGLFLNAGYKIFDNSALSFYGRRDDHNTAGKNNTYKLSYIQNINNFQFGLSNATGLRNPTLYELFGSNNYGYKGDINLKAEKSRTNEIFGSYDLFDNLTLKSTAYRSTFSDRLETNSEFTATENKQIDLNAEGLENELIFKGKDQKLSVFVNFTKSKNPTNGKSQQRRPDLSYGSNYSKKFIDSVFGPINLNINYKFTGKHSDYDGGQVMVKKTNIIDMQISKKLFGSLWSVNISNLLDEKYERPATYSQDGRRLRIGYKKSY